MVQVELNNMYINVGANSDSENLLLLLLLLTAIELSLDDSSPYTSTNKTNKYKCTSRKQYKTQYKKYKTQ